MWIPSIATGCDSIGCTWMKLEFKIVRLLYFDPFHAFHWCVRLNWVILHFVGFAAFLGPAVGSLMEPRGATFLTL